MNLEHARRLVETATEESARDYVINPVLIQDMLKAAALLERERLLVIVEGLIERFEHVATFKDGRQERVVYAAALEVELQRALRGSDGK